MLGYSYGATIRNVVLDSSCSINSYMSCGISGYCTAYIGGIVGECYSNSNNICSIENNVNMARILSSVSEHFYLGDSYIGGAAGYIGSSSTNAVTVKNCVNYGPITLRGEIESVVVGGVVGYIGNSPIRLMYRTASTMA